MRWLSLALALILVPAAWSAPFPAPTLLDEKTALLGEMEAWRAVHIGENPAPGSTAAAYDLRLKRIQSLVQFSRSKSELAAPRRRFEEWKEAWLQKRYAAAGGPASYPMFKRGAEKAVEAREHEAQTLAFRFVQGVRRTASSLIRRGGALFDGSRDADADDETPVVDTRKPTNLNDPRAYAQIRRQLIAQGAQRWIVDAVIREAIRQKADPILALAIVNQESQFKPHATSFKRDAQGRVVRDRHGRAVPLARGLMQLTADKGSNLYDVRTNVRLGIGYLKSLWNRFVGIDMSLFSRISPFSRHDVKLAIAAYNAGPGKVEQYGGVPPYRETRGYVDNVLGYYARFKSALKRRL